MFNYAEGIVGFEKSDNASSSDRWNPTPLDYLVPLRPMRHHFPSLIVSDNGRSITGPTILGQSLLHL